MKLSIIILSWNCEAYLSSCLSSLISNTVFIEKEIIVIDNASTDASVQFIKENYPCIILIKNDKNMGVGPARNQGLKIAKGEFILILDADTIIYRNSIKPLLSIMELDKKIGIVGPKLIDKHRDLQFSCRDFPTLLSKIYRQLPQKFQNIFLKKEEFRGWDHNSLLEVGYVIGACQLIRKRVIEEVGLFDPRMFYGVEEIDYCLRTWKKGWKVVYNPAAVITHIEQRIGRKQAIGRLQLEHIKSLIFYFWKYKYLFRPPTIKELTVKAAGIN